MRWCCQKRNRLCWKYFCIILPRIGNGKKNHKDISEQKAFSKLFIFSKIENIMNVQYSKIICSAFGLWKGVAKWWRRTEPSQNWGMDQTSEGNSWNSCNNLSHLCNIILFRKHCNYIVLFNSQIAFWWWNKKGTLSIPLPTLCYMEEETEDQWGWMACPYSQN